eukprot:TRINITY_DN5583_c0_g1_i6.p1 TRINITY_DN5583_c0_g1~~TRINITY_DN5583_c0_g1_i6.p1  ORF type:complete len:438 (-),score=95.72 TRINITY_DN5583_c0_g1_i6:95-1408(-)
MCWWKSENEPRLYEESFRIKKHFGQTNFSDLSRKCEIKLQPYRHVDVVQFENSKIFDSFVEGVNAGNQQFGWLYGRYLPTSLSEVPLGIKALVSAIYSPTSWRNPQEGEMERTDMVASRFGLKRVGWIFTQLGVSHKDRHKYKPPHTAQELWNVARIQNLFRSEWNNSTNSGGSAGGGGFFGSKFVNIIVTEDENGKIIPTSIQLSNQALTLINEKVIKPSKSTHFHVTRNSEEWLYPSIIVPGKNGTRAIKQHEYLERDIFFLLTTFQEVTISQDNHVTTFPSSLFPVSYDFRNQSFWKDFKIQIDEAKKKLSNRLEVFADFHFLCWMKMSFVGENEGIIFEQLVKAIIEKNDSELEEFITHLEHVYQKYVCPPPQDVSNPIVSQPSLPPPCDVDEEKLVTLLSMGFDEEMCRTALVVCDGNVEQSLDWIFFNSTF